MPTRFVLFSDEDLVVMERLLWKAEWTRRVERMRQEIESERTRREAKRR